MFDLIELRALLDDFLDQAPKLSPDELAQSYLSLDQTVSEAERKNHLRAHKLNVMKNIAYVTSFHTGEANACAARDFFVRLRDAGCFFANYRKAVVMLREAHTEAAALLSSRGVPELATEALKNSSRFGSTIDNTFFSTKTVYPGWFERHVRMGGGDILAIDYVKGSLVVLSNPLATVPQVDALDIGIEDPVEDIIMLEDGWYFLTAKGTRVIETAKDFAIRRMHVLNLPPSGISRHFTQNDSHFACTQFNEIVYFLDKQFRVTDKLSITGAQELRKPVFLDDMLYVLNFSRGSIGSSELLAIGSDKRVRCVYDGLDNPMSMIIKGKTIAVGDSLGIHIIDASQPHRAKLLYFSDIIDEVDKGPYCNHMEFTEEGIILYILFLEDFALSKKISQHVSVHDKN